MEELDLRATEPAFGATWFIVVGLLLAIFIYLKFANKELLQRFIANNKKDERYDMQTVSQLHDAKVIKVTVEGKETFIYSDSKTSFEMKFKNAVNQKEIEVVDSATNEDKDNV
ncbi:hypothetical protein [Pleionea sediminis]|uniref:hypothetical protein n=1 Tax=Pleionea sediminis TaxID=2569479 RepID=UPI001186C734|nr:hypothetical protein [Pleionea sediminis]